MNKRKNEIHSKTVPSVDFYGDSTTWPTKELVYSEALAERSALHDWRIRPHRHTETVQLFLISRGHGRARLDSVWYDVQAPCVVVIPERAIHEFEWNRSSEGYVLSIRSSLTRMLESKMESAGAVFGSVAVIEASDIVDSLFHQLHAEIVNAKEYTDIALESLLQFLTVWLARVSKASPSVADSHGRAGKHFVKFTTLVDEHHKKHWTVANYSDAIGITPSHLNAICQRVRATSALQIINARLIVAARRELAYTERNISGVATSLGFEDPSYFSRFFRRETGMAPGEYRKRSGTLEGAG